MVTQHFQYNLSISYLGVNIKHRRAKIIHNSRSVTHDSRKNLRTSYDHLLFFSFLFIS